MLANILTNFNNGDKKIIQKAFEFAKKAHQSQLRQSGQDYIIHPVAVAEFLADLGMDAVTVSAALLHDTLEDTPATHDQLEKEFGKEITFLVDGVTKLNVIQYPRRSKNPGDAQIDSLKKMFFAMAEDIRVILIKLADRFHNMETLKYMTPEAQVRIAAETLEIYAPIADRLGMGKLKGQLEDLCFPYVYPQEHRTLVKSVKEKYDDRLKYIERTKPIIALKIKEAGVPLVAINSRAKHYYSLYQKLQRFDMDVEKVFDLVALRIIVPDIKSCYEVLGVIHKYYRPLPGKIKDYIALPKPNGYKSIHTTVFCEKGRIAEIQIRTPEMHDHAENGIAAHWAYSESGKRVPIIANQTEIKWVNQLKNFLKEIKTHEGLKNIKIDFFKHRIFVFTPQGDVKDLPQGATPVDFAYAVHSGIGHATAGAKVNAKIVPLDFELSNGDVIEIIKHKKPRPSFDWLRFVKTAEARKHIRNWHKNNSPVFKDEKEKEIVKAKPTKTKTATATHNSQVTINGQTGLLYKIGKCCAPALGQEIKGYITRSRGVTVHLISCKNIKDADKSRILKTNWS